MYIYIHTPDTALSLHPSVSRSPASRQTGWEKSFNLLHIYQQQELIPWNVGQAVSLHKSYLYGPLRQMFSCVCK